MHGKSILLAEDDDDDFFFFFEAINAVAPGTRLHHARDGAEFIRFLQQASVLPHIVFLDINMPRKNGYDSLLEMRADKRLKDIPVIVFSTSLYDELTRQMMEAGANYCICKPSDFNMWKRHIKKVLETNWQQQLVGLVEETRFIE